MAKTSLPAALTANDLLEGDAVWWTGAGWSRDIAEAAVAETAEAAETLAAEAGAPAHEATVVGPYLVEVRVSAGAPFPTLRREAIRADRAPTFAYAPDAYADAA